MIASGTFDYGTRESMHFVGDFTSKAVVVVYAPIAGHNLFRIGELNEELGDRVFAKLKG